MENVGNARIMHGWDLVSENARFKHGLCRILHGKNFKLKTVYGFNMEYVGFMHGNNLEFQWSLDTRK